MRNWIVKIREHCAAILDALAVLALSLALCGLLVGFCITRLSAPLWETKLHGLSQDGSLYVGISHAGIRLHEVESGKEIDRIALRGPLESACILWSNDPEHYANGLGNHPLPLHPLEASAPPNLGFDHSFAFGNVTEPYGRARIVVSTSKRYVAAMFPAGYYLVWDRASDNCRIIGEPDYFFEQISINEARGELLIEGIRRLRDEVILDESSPLLKQDSPRVLSLPIETLTYSLETLQRLNVKTLASAGQRIDSDRNLRFTYDEAEKQYRVWQWEDFPRGEPKLLHGFLRSPQKSQDQAKDVLRISEGVCYLARFTKGEVEFTCHSDGVTTSNKLKLPSDYDAKEVRWFADGHTLIRGDEQNQLFTWDADRSWALYQTPFSSCHEAVVIRDVEGEKRLRAASEEGDIVDLPIGVNGNAIRHRLDLRVFPNLVTFAGAVVAAIGVAWCSWAAWRGSLFAKCGWMVVLLLCAWLAVIWSIEVFANRMDYGFAVYFAAWLILALTSFASGLSLLSSRTTLRAAAVMAVALFGMFVLMELPSRVQFLVRRPLAGQECCLFVEDEEPHQW